VPIRRVVVRRGAGDLPRRAGAVRSIRLRAVLLAPGLPARTALPGSCRVTCAPPQYRIPWAIAVVAASRTRASVPMRGRERSARRRREAPFGLQIPVAASTVTDPRLPRPQQNRPLTSEMGEKSLASGRNVRTVLNVVRRPETLRSGVVPLVEKRVESLQHESLVLFLDCLRHLILLRFTLPRLSVP
jgi:hypothetical protein